MFERYTEKARQTIFFARYEASQFGSRAIETEHLLLGLLRQDKELTSAYLPSQSALESVRRQIEERAAPREKLSVSVDLPLSNESKRVLNHAADEAERLGHRHIGTEHLLLGLLREEKCFAAQILRERGLELTAAREAVKRQPAEAERPVSEPPEPGHIGWVDLTVENAGELRDFYQDVVGWTVSEVPMAGYSDFMMNTPASKKAVAGVCHARATGRASFPSRA